MAVWFVRSNGETLHNEPGSKCFVPGEPPTFPKRAFDYAEECRRYGFIRVGWPATGDLRDQDWPKRALEVYANHMDEHHRRYLQQFSTIRTGDVVLMPSGLGQHSVHVGAVVLRDALTRDIKTVRPRLSAYSYFHDTDHGQWFENAHRVDVLWDADADGLFAAHQIPSLGGLWRRAFGAVGLGAKAVQRLARGLGLPISELENH